jgi:DNA-binding NarL/FixJ family response regulator
MLPAMGWVPVRWSMDVVGNPLALAGHGELVLLCAPASAASQAVLFEREGFVTHLSGRGRDGGPPDLLELESLLRNLSPRAVLIDAQDCRRLEPAWLVRLRRLFPRTDWVIGWRWPDCIDVELLVRCAARGCLRWDAPEAERLRGLRAVLAGHLWLSRDLLQAAYLSLLGEQRACPTTSTPTSGRPVSVVPVAESGLTARQGEVLALVREGYSNKQIAARLRISPNTVKKHLSNIFDKHDLRTRRQVLRVPQVGAPPEMARIRPGAPG